MWWGGASKKIVAPVARGREVLCKQRLVENERFVSTRAKTTAVKQLLQPLNSESVRDRQRDEKVYECRTGWCRVARNPATRFVASDVIVIDWTEAPRLTVSHRAIKQKHALVLVVLPTAAHATTLLLHTLPDPQFTPVAGQHNTGTGDSQETHHHAATKKKKTFKVLI